MRITNWESELPDYELGVANWELPIGIGFGRRNATVGYGRGPDK